jgi:hypothetical protein
VKGAVNVVVDSGGSVHLGWIADVSGALRFYYSLRQSGQSQFATAVATNSGGLFNSRLAVSSGGTYAHATIENFSGDVPFIIYARFSGGSGGSSVAATPQIASGAAMIKRPSTVSVGFLSVNGDPKQIRWRWNSAPTDTTTDSGGWQTFANPMTITVPTSVLDAATCTAVSLYTQVRDANQTAGQAQSDGVVIDAGVTAAVALSNPHLLSKSSQFSNLDATLGDYSSDGGSSDGHPNYTREPWMYVGVQGQSECSGLADLATGRSTKTVAPALTISKDFFSNVLSPPNGLTAGSNEVLLRVSDKVGNTKDYTQTLIFDTVAPTLDSAAPGSLSVTSNASATILASLAFSNIKVTDNIYPGRGFWGVWLANSRDAVTDPASSASLIWYPVAAPGSTSTFTILNWSLASGLKNSQLTTGDYYVYARFLDGAGNPTASVLPVAKVNLATVTFPKVYMPLTKR